MRTRWAVALLFLTTAMPKEGKAQVYQFATPPPAVNASAAAWQIASVPIEFNGLVYQPTAFVRPFDGNVMTQVGVFDSVPIYADATLEPFSIVYVPVARGMRTYERERAGELAGTTGSQTPSMPVQPVSAISLPPLPLATSGVRDTREPSSARAIEVRTAPAAPSRVESLPHPRATDGVWIPFDGAKWYSAGEAVPYSPERFVQVGSYRGFAVYRERHRRNAREIWVTVVADGPLAPYARR